MEIERKARTSKYRFGVGFSCQPCQPSNGRAGVKVVHVRLRGLRDVAVSPLLRV